jgi:hypothetical protein
MEPLLWDTPEQARHSARVIMDEYGLSWATKNLLCAIIKAESGFNIHAVNHNPHSSDFGIVQMNDRLWIGPGKYFSSVEEVYNNPAKSVRFLVDAYIKNRLGWWMAYTNGSYRRFLN